jgi:PAS domain S-box-containing protein
MDFLEGRIGPTMRLAGVDLRTNGDYLLRDADLELAAGEVHALVGGTNEGKSAVCSLVAGEIPPTAGAVLFRGELLPVQGRRKMMAKGIMKVPKTPQLFPHLTVAQNLIAGYSGGWLSNWRSWKEESRRLEAWLDRYDIRVALNTPLSFVPREEWLFFQMLNHLYKRPTVFILDETLELLSPEQRGKIWPLLIEKATQGMTALWATQSLDDALTYTNRISVMHDSRLLFTNNTGSLDRLSLVRLCYHRLLKGTDTTLEQFHQTLCFTEAALRDLPTAVLVMDDERTIRFVNQAAGKLFGRRTVALMGLPLCSIHGEKLRELSILIQTAIDESEETGEDVHWDNQPYSQDGKTRLADIRIRPITEGSRVIGHMVVIEDVSVREELRRQLAVSENLASVGLLAAGVAHEINNPLAVISNYNRYLRGKAVEKGQIEAVGQIETQTKNIRDIVKNLALFSIDKPQGRIPVDLCALASELCHLVRADHRSKTIDMCCDGNGTAVVFADLNEMRLVILNLIRNAVDAQAGNPGKIDIVFGCERRDNREFVTLTVSDSGPGISFADPNQVFLPFVSTKAATGNNYGLGLSIVHQIVTKYDGIVSAENLPSGGCMFRVLLPCAVIVRNTDAEH